MDDIHRLNILKLNEVRTEIWNYANTSLSKSEKKNLEREIVKNTKRTAEDLGRRINVLDMQVARFLSDLKEDMRKSR